MLVAFSHARDFPATLALAKHLSKPVFDEYTYQERTKLLADQLAKRDDDFKKFTLPEPAKWEELKKNLLVALDHTESQLSDQLRAREGRERLNAGRHDAVADTYRELVDRYYQSLAAPRRPNR